MHDSSSHCKCRTDTYRISYMETEFDALSFTSQRKQHNLDAAEIGPGSLFSDSPPGDRHRFCPSPTETKSERRAHHDSKRLHSLGCRQLRRQLRSQLQPWKERTYYLNFVLVLPSAKIIAATQVASQLPAQLAIHF